MNAVSFISLALRCGELIVCCIPTPKDLSMLLWAEIACDFLDGESALATVERSGFFTMGWVDESLDTQVVVEVPPSVLLLHVKFVVCLGIVCMCDDAILHLVFPFPDRGVRWTHAHDCR